MNMEDIYMTVGRLYLEIIKSNTTVTDLQKQVGALQAKNDELTLQLKVFEEKKNKEITG